MELQKIADELDKYLDEFKLKYDTHWSAFFYVKDNQILVEDLTNIPIVIDNLEIGKRFIEEYFENYNEQMLKWEEHFREQVLKMANEELLWEVVNYQGGDWDGLLSSREVKEKRILSEELEKRLKEIKFL